MAKTIRELSPTEAEIEAFVSEHLTSYHAEIGRIASVWAMLEFRLDQLIWHLMGIEQTLGACLTTQMMGTTPRLRALKAMMELRGSDPELIKRLNKYTADIITHQEDRNRAVHDPWFVGSESKSASQIRKAVVNNRVVYDLDPVQLDKLREIYKKSRECLFMFNDLRDDILSERPLSLQKRRRTQLWQASL